MNAYHLLNIVSEIEVPRLTPEPHHNQSSVVGMTYNAYYYKPFVGCDYDEMVLELDYLFNSLEDKPMYLCWSSSIVPVQRRANGSVFIQSINFGEGI